MNENPMKPAPRPLGALRRQSVRVSAAEMVTESYLGAGPGLPVVMKPAMEAVDLPAWLATQRDRIAGHLRRSGGVLFRDFGLDGLPRFESCVAAFSGELLEYTFRSTPRRPVSGRVYTSTEYPPDQSIPMHNEMSYTSRWPMKIWFFCVLPAAEGGETPIADSRRVYQALDPEVRDELVRKGVMYVRNYGDRLDLPWQEVFQTADRAEVEAFCRESGIATEWKAGNRLRTRQVCPAVAHHPESGEAVWFNQAHLFHVSSLPRDLCDSLLRDYGEEDLPRNTYFGDGSPIPEAALSHIAEVFARESVVFSWQRGDLLLLDNMLAAHGRRPFSGERKVVVAMTEARSLDGAGLVG